MDIKLCIKLECFFLFFLFDTIKFDVFHDICNGDNVHRTTSARMMDGYTNFAPGKKKNGIGLGTKSLCGAKRKKNSRSLK